MNIRASNIAVLATLGLLVSCASIDGKLALADAESSNPTSNAFEIHEFGRGGSKPVLLFHMAGSNVRGEYTRIAPRLVEAGYHVFGVDLPGGGDRFDGVNTVASTASEIDYCADYAPMLAAIDAVNARAGERPVLIGSSYTAALVTKAAVDRPDKVAGFVSLSPAPAAGLEICAPATALADLEVDGIGIRPRSELEHDIIKDQAREWAQHGVPTKIVEVRSHGASALDPERSGENAEVFWPALLWFLEQTSI